MFLASRLRRLAPLVLLSVPCLAIAQPLSPTAAGEDSIRVLGVPTVDLSQDTSRQSIIAQGTADVYQGHPTTVLMPDGKTIFAAWSYDHGGPAGPLARSDDGGQTWSGLITVGDNWSSVRNCPAIYRLTDPQGVARLIVYSGGDKNPDNMMFRSVSEDDGNTWSDMQPINIASVMPWCTIEPVDGGKRLLAMTNSRRPNDPNTKSNQVIQSYSEDGGLTWSPATIALDMPEKSPCEPGLVRSPDGKQLLVLIRNNSRKGNSLAMTSDDEGRTWSKPFDLSPAATGDRHVARYTHDGKLVVAFRDRAKGSPTFGDFVAWVGSYADLIEGKPGDTRIKLLHHFGRRGDTGYPGLEVLPDNTVVATTYCQMNPGPEKNSVVSVRFRLDELASLTQARDGARH